MKLDIFPDPPLNFEKLFNLQFHSSDFFFFLLNTYSMTKGTEEIVKQIMRVKKRCIDCSRAKFIQLKEVKTMRITHQ